VLLFPLLLAPSAMVAVSTAERRFGPAVAGWLNAAPLSITIAVLAVAADRGSPAAAAVALSAAAHVPAQVAFAVTFAAVLRHTTRPATAAARGDLADSPLVAIARRHRLTGLLPAVAAIARLDRVARLLPAAVAITRRGRLAGRGRRAPLAAGLVAATAAFAALSLVLAFIPAPVAAAGAVPSLLAGRRLLPGVGAPAGEGSGGDVVVRAVVALAVIAAVLTAVRAAGPGIGGAVAAYPALTATLAALVGRERGTVAVEHLLGGVVRGLSGYLVFCVALACTAPSLGIALAASLGVAACAIAFAATWRGVRIPAPA
jgi:hypothetical protein